MNRVASPARSWGELPESSRVRVRVQGSFGAKNAPQDDNVCFDSAFFVTAFSLTERLVNLMEEAYEEKSDGGGDED